MGDQSLLARLRAFLDGEATAPADATETPEPIGKGESPADETPAVEAGDETNPETGAPAAAEPGTAGESVETQGEPEGGPTLPEPSTNLSDEERDTANDLAVTIEALRDENNRLRDRIAELGGDTALGISEEVVEIAPEDEIDEYDADADIEAQKAEIARLKGE